MQPPARPDRSAYHDRRLRLRAIVAEVGSMVSRAEDLRDHTQAESLRVLLRHFESELVRLRTHEGGTVNGELLARDSQSIEQATAPLGHEGDE